MSYAIKEIFLTLQGEGAQAGRVAVFCRFAGCNRGSGRGEDRASAVCTFCDTYFVGTDGTRGGRYDTADRLADTIAAEWGSSQDRRFVVLTGGEHRLSEAARPPRNQVSRSTPCSSRSASTSLTESSVSPSMMLMSSMAAAGVTICL